MSIFKTTLVEGDYDLSNGSTLTITNADAGSGDCRMYFGMPERKGYYMRPEAIDELIGVLKKVKDALPPVQPAFTDD